MTSARFDASENSAQSNVLLIMRERGRLQSTRSLDEILHRQDLDLKLLNARRSTYRGDVVLERRKLAFGDRSSSSNSSFKTAALFAAGAVAPSAFRA